MNIALLIQEIREFLLATFAEIDLWFDKDSGLQSYQPKNGGWSINQI